MRTKKPIEKVDENFLKNVWKKITRFSEPEMAPQNLPKPTSSQWTRPSLKSLRNVERKKTAFSAFKDEPEFKQQSGPSILALERRSIMQAVFPRISKSDPKLFFTSLYNKDKDALLTFTNSLKNYLNNPTYLDKSDLTVVFNLIDDVYEKTGYEPLRQIYSDFQNVIKSMAQVNENLKLILKSYIKSLILESKF